MPRLLGVILLLLLFSLSTSLFFIWFPVFLLNSPFLIGASTLIYFTRLRKPFSRLLFSLYERLVDRNTLLWDAIYSFLALLYPISISSFMNYGYKPLSGSPFTLTLSNEEEEQNRMALQLYYWCFSSCLEVHSLSGSSVLEVSSGRGFGLDFIIDKMTPERAVGVDISRSNVEFSRRKFKSHRNLYFHQGSAENLSSVSGLLNGSFDLIVSIDAAHLYQNFPKFVEEAHGLLKPSGRLVLSDFREASSWPGIQGALSGFFYISKCENISKNVLQAMRVERQRRLEEVNQTVHWGLKPLIKHYKVGEVTQIENYLETGFFESQTIVCIRKE